MDKPRFQAGYDTAKADLRKLLAKVDEKKKLGVVMAWLHEGAASEVPGRKG